MRNRKHGFAKTIRPLICVSLTTAGTDTTITAIRLKDELITFWAVIDKTAIVVAITA
jgi:hypothetical protein